MKREFQQHRCLKCGRFISADNISYIDYERNGDVCYECAEKEGD